MNQRKRYGHWGYCSSLIFCICLVVGLAGCGQGEDTSGEANTRLSAAEYEKLATHFQNLLEYQKDLSLWLEQAKQYAQRYPEDYKLIRLYAHGLYETRQWELAFQSFKQSLDTQSDQPELLANAGTCAFQIKKYGYAEQYYQRAIDLRPDKKIFRVFLAHAYLYEKKWSLAKKLLDDVIRGDGLEAGESISDQYLHRAYYVRSELYKMQKQYLLAVQDAMQAILHANKLASGSDKIRYTRCLAELYRLDGNYMTALAVLGRINIKDRQSLAVLADTAKVYEATMRPDLAADLYANAFYDKPQDWRLAKYAAHWYIKAQQVEQGQYYIEKYKALRSSAKTLTQLEEDLKALKQTLKKKKADHAKPMD